MSGRISFIVMQLNDIVRVMYGAKQVERHVTVPTEMYADRTTGDWNRRRSIRERLGVWMEPVRAAPQSTGAKR